MRTKRCASADGELDAYWGDYVGMPEEILVSGKLKDIVGESRKDAIGCAEGERMDHGLRGAEEAPQGISRVDHVDLT